MWASALAVCIADDEQHARSRRRVARLIQARRAQFETRARERFYGGMTPTERAWFGGGK